MVTVRVVEGVPVPAADGEPPQVPARLRRVDVDELPALLARPDVRCWVDLDRPSPEELSRVTGIFGFHPLAVEDCRAPSHEPKVETYNGYVFLIVHAVDLESIRDRVTTTDLECFFAQRYLVTHHVRAQPAIDQLAARVDQEPSLLAAGTDRVLHELLDAVVDRYFPALAAMDARSEQLEAAILAGRRRDPLPRLLALKREVTHLKRIVGPQVDAVRKLAGRGLPPVSQQAALYFRDVLDHLQRIEGEVENLRDELTSLMQVHVAVASYRLNEAIRLLTIFAAVLLPLQLIAGIYGMNFEEMPGLGWRYGYHSALALMAAVAVGMLLYFRRRGWL